MPGGAKSLEQSVVDLQHVVADLTRRVAGLEHATHGAPQGPAPAPAPAPALQPGAPPA
jgi:hypothetical protein